MRVTNGKIKSFITWIFSNRKRAVVTALLIAAGVFFGFRNYTKADFEAEVETIKKQELTQTITASGSVSAEKFAKLTFLASENIDEILVEDGAKVEEGDIIARLDTTSLYQSFLKAESNLRDKQATLNRVYDDLQGKEDTETFEEKEDRVAAEAAKDKAYRDYVIAQNNLGNATLRAPFEGIVNFNDGTSIGKLSLTTTPTFTIVDPKTIYFVAEVNEVDVAKIKKGAKAIIKLDAFPEENFEEEVKSVSFVSTTTSTGGTAYEVRVGLPQTDEDKVRVGMNGDADFIISEKKDILTVPLTTVVEENNKTFVWVLERGRAVKKEVETGISSIDYMEIKSGLSEGETVILNPPSDLSQDSRVKAL